MSVEDDDIAWIKQELESLSRNAKTPDDLGAVMIERLASGYEDRVATQRIEAQPRGAAIGRWLRKALQPQFRQNAQYLLSVAFIDALEARREITKQQRRVITHYRVIQFVDDGKILVVLPPQSAYRRAIIMMLVLSIPAVIAVALAWEVFSTSLVGIAISWTMGALLGWIARETYDSAWGRQKIAKALHAKYRWLAIVDTQAPPIC